jgi:hypothetical protein
MEDEYHPFEMEVNGMTVDVDDDPFEEEEPPKAFKNPFTIKTKAIEKKPIVYFTEKEEEVEDKRGVKRSRHIFEQDDDNEVDYTKRISRRPRYLNDYETNNRDNDDLFDDKDGLFQIKPARKTKQSWTKFKKDKKDELIDEVLFPFVTKLYRTIRNEDGEDEDKLTKFHILDKKLPPLKKYFRPYFSPRHGSWEIDYMYSGTFTFGNDIYFRFYLVCININTKYAVVFPMNKNEHYDTKFSLSCIKELQRKALVTNIRADDDPSFGHELNVHLRSDNVTTFYSRWKHTNKNRVVDRFIRTIRDAVGLETSLILNPNIVEEIVYIYNHTPHSAFLNRFTPYQAQNDPDLESWYIRRQQLELYKIQKLQLQELGSYKVGNILMIHVPKEKTGERFEKRRRNFDELGIFVRYVHGNVMVTRMKNKNVIVLPIFYTKFLADSLKDLSKEYVDFFKHPNSVDFEKF